MQLPIISEIITVQLKTVFTMMYALLTRHRISRNNKFHNRLCSTHYYSNNLTIHCKTTDCLSIENIHKIRWMKYIFNRNR